MVSLASGLLTIAGCAGAVAWLVRLAARRSPLCPGTILMPSAKNHKCASAARKALRVLLPLTAERVSVEESPLNCGLCSRWC